MVLDKEIHRELILTMINSCTFQGNGLDLVMEFRQAVQKAQVLDPETQDTLIQRLLDDNPS